MCVVSKWWWNYRAQWYDNKLEPNKHWTALGAYFLIKLFSLEELGQIKQAETHAFVSGDKWQP